ncbi:MAG: archaellin/type IV pilin N-terminal domain-containing protein [Candidatus Bathyarchaeia archaeon]
MRNINNKRALSPVIATVILVAVAITVAVAVAYWMGGIAGQYTKFEKIEIQSALCTYTNETWTITLSVKNTGTTTATLDKVFINGIEITDSDGVPDPQSASHSMGVNGMTLTSGYSDTIVIKIKKGWQTVSSGTTINIKLHSTGGMEYLKMVELV